MTVHIDKVKPFLGEVPKSWFADEPSSDVKELPEKAADRSMEETLVKTPNNEPSSEQVQDETFDDELIYKNATSTNVPYEVDSTQPTVRPRREVRAPKYLDGYVRLIPASKQKSD